MSLNRQHNREQSHIRKLPGCSLGGGVLAEQLESELELRKVCQELINSYKETQTWEAVSQVAQTLAVNDVRIKRLKQQIQESASRETSSYLDNISESRKVQQPDSPPAPVSPAADQQQHSRESLEFSIEGDVDQHLVRESRDAGNVNCGSLEPPERSPVQVNYPLSAPTHTITSSPLREVSPLPNSEAPNTGHSITESDLKMEVARQDQCEPDTPSLSAEDHNHSVDELDDITQLMESLADQFEDMGKEHQSLEPPGHADENSGLAEHQTTTDTSSGHANLEVPVDNKAGYASSEGSSQFYSPRDSPFSGSDDDEDKEFIDASTESDRVFAASSEDKLATVCRNEKIFSVTKTSCGDGNVYCIVLEREPGLQLAGALQEPVLRTSSHISQLRDQLELTEKFPIHELVGGQEDLDVSEDLEQFLNYVASSPFLRSSSYFLNFLQVVGSQEEKSDDVVTSLLPPGHRLGSERPVDVAVDGNHETEQNSDLLEASSEQAEGVQKEIEEHPLVEPESKVTMDHNESLLSELQTQHNQSSSSVLNGNNDVDDTVVNVGQKEMPMESSDSKLTKEDEAKLVESSPVIAAEDEVGSTLQTVENIEPSPLLKSVVTKPDSTSSGDEQLSTLPSTEPTTATASVMSAAESRTLVKEPSPVVDSLDEEALEEESGVSKGLVKETSLASKPTVMEPVVPASAAAEEYISERSVETNLVQKEISPESEPVQREPSPESEQVLRKPSPVPEAELKEPPPPVPELQDPFPGPGEKEQSIVPASVLKESSPVSEVVLKKNSESELVQEEPCLEVEPVTKESSQKLKLVSRAFSPEPIQKEPSPAPELVLKEPSPAPELVLKELSPTPEPVLKEPSPEAGPELKELSLERVLKEPSPVPEQELKEPSPAPEPVPKEQSPVTESVVKEPSAAIEPVLKEPSLSLVPEPVLEEPSPASESLLKDPSPVPEPVLEEPFPEPESILTESSPVPEQVVNEPSPAPKPLLKEPSSVAEPVLKEPSPEPEPVLKEPSPVPEPVLKEPSPEPEPVLKEPSPVPEPVLEELSLEPESVLKEPSPVLEPVLEDPFPEPELVLKEPSPVSELVVKQPSPVPEPVLKEPSPVPEPILKEPPLLPEQVLKESSPVPEPVLEEPSPVPEPVLKEPSPVPEQVVKEPSPALEPTLKEFSPVLEPVLKEPSPVPEQVVKEPSPALEPILKEFSPAPEPVLKGPSPVPEPVLKDPSPVPELILKEFSSAPEPVLKEPSPAPEPVPNKPSFVPEQVVDEPSELILKEPSPVPQPVLKKPSPAPEPVPKEPLPVSEPVLEELSPAPELVLKEPSFIPEQVVKEPSPAPKLTQKEPSPMPEPVPSLTPEPVLKEPSPAPEPVLKEPSPAPEPVLKEPSPAPEPVLKEPSPAPEPVLKEPSFVPEQAEKEPSPVPKLTREEPSPAPEPVLKEPSPAPEPVLKEPEPVLKGPSPAPEPLLKEPSPVPEPVHYPVPKPELNTSSPVPEPVPKELSPVPETVVKDPSPAPEPVLKEPSPVPEPLLKEPSPAPEPVLKEASQVPEPLLKEPSPAPEPVLKEPSPVPEPLLKEPSPAPEPVLKEPSQVPEPLLKEPSPAPEPVLKEPSPVPEPVPSLEPKPEMNESLPVPESVPKELSPVPETVVKEPYPAPGPEEPAPSEPPKLIYSETVSSTSKGSVLPLAECSANQNGIERSETSGELSEVSELNPLKETTDDRKDGALEEMEKPIHSTDSLLLENAVSDEQKMSKNEAVDEKPVLKSNGLETAEVMEQAMASKETEPCKVAEGSAAVSPSHSDPTVVSPSHSGPYLESSTASSAVGTDNSSTAGLPGSGSDSPSQHSREASLQGSANFEAGTDLIRPDGVTPEAGEPHLRKSKTVKNFIKKGTKSIRKNIKRSASQFGKNKVGKMSTSLDPSLAKPVKTQDWDPTCLLEELYLDFRPSTRGAALSGETARHYGYLEKLPKNATKATMMKGWKRRYFRVMDDKIYYYEERTSPKALGFVRLSISKINPIPEKNQIQVSEKGGQSIMLRARDKEDMTAWHRVILLEAAHPTPLMATPSSPMATVDSALVLIIDIGASSVRAGYSGRDAYPELYFPAVASLEATSYTPIGSGTIALLPDNRYGAYQVYPRKEHIRMDRTDSNLVLRALSSIIDTVVTDLDVDTENTDLIMTVPHTVPNSQREELLEQLFEDFQFSAVCFQDQSLLSLYSYNTTSGIIVNIGDHIDVVPIIDGYTIEAGVSHLPHGGNAITENLSKLITTKGLRYFSETEMYIVRLIKEQLCYVSQMYADDIARCEATPAGYTRATDMDRFQLPDHRKVVALDLECFKAPEGLFKPDLWGKDVPGLHELVWKAIQACPIDQRREMAKKIYLSGSTTLLPCLQERLQKEVASLTTTSITVEVHAGQSRQHAAFLGAAVLATLGSFQDYLITKEEFAASGFDVLKKWKTS